MIDKIKTHIFNAEGRLNRLRYFKYTMIWSFGISILSAIIDVVVLIATGEEDNLLLNIVDVVLVAAICIGGFMLQIRRCHDLDKSGWFVLINIIPIVDVIFGLYLLFAKGTEGTNRYGDDPLLQN